MVGLYVSTLSTGVLQLISGWTLTNAVFKIRFFFKYHKQQAFMDLNYLALHGSAFTMYLVGVLFYYTLQTIYFVTPTKNLVFGLYNVIAIVQICFSFVSQLLLLCILQDLSNRQKAKPVTARKQFQ
jgi:hypothetical protein